MFQQGWHADVPSLIRQLLCHGIPLNTFLITQLQDAILPPLELGPPPPLPRVSIQLDWRTTDYGTYEQACNTFLARSYAHAALLKGRIVGHLAREYLDIASVTEGPSQDVFMFGTSLCSSDGRLFWDDNINSSEMDLMCVYKTPTGQGMQTTDLSWWPKQVTWVGSNFNVGYWAPDNEVWFHTHLAKIWVGEVQPQNACHWTNALKKFKITAKIVHNYRSACADYLSESLEM